MNLKSHLNPHFGVTPAANIQRSKFDRSHAHKTTFNSGLLIPFLVDLDVLPGDTFNCRSSFFARLSTPLKPVMDNMYLETFYFFVPNRLLWTNWEKFCGSQVNPGDSISYTIPTVPMAIGGPPVHTLHNYFGIPAGAQITGTFSVNALASRAYNLIYNTHFRDENLQNSVTVDTGDGPDTLANYVVKKRGKRADYFTSCLPWPQKQSSGVSIGLTGNATVNRVSSAANGWKGYIAGTNTLWTDGANVSITTSGQITDGSVGTLDPRGGLVADLTSVSGVTINALRLAEATQVLLERDGRGGTRYCEIIKSHFQVSNPMDNVLQRPEYLGGGSTQINFHPVPLTTKGDGTTPGAQGNLAAFATAAATGHGFNKSFTEHGVVIGLMCVRADLTYQQGLDRMWTRSTRYDYYWPSLAHIGEQAVLNQEIWLQGDGATNDQNVFGYQERHAEYRSKKSTITGKFASDYATPLDTFHLAQRFTSLPTLGDTFISETPPVSRIVAVTSEPEFMMDSWHDYKCARPMPVYGIPQLGGKM